jgi:Spy/CpxP family protein refolding chaperone
MKSPIKTLVSSLMLAGVIMFSPAYAQNSDPIDQLAQELNLTDAQKQKMRKVFEDFTQKQEQVPLPGQVALQNRAMLKDIITSPEFDKSKAQAFVGKITAIITEATVNRLQLRHDLYQQLDAQQQAQYLGMVQERVAEMLQ